jgi:hypothetical protein
MECGRTWSKSKGNVWSISITEVANVFSLVGRLKVVSWANPPIKITKKTYSQTDLAHGVEINISAGKTYTLDIIVTPVKSASATVHTKIAFDNVIAVDDDCDRDATDPICEWLVRRV